MKAFPISFKSEDDADFGGMDLRDYFAGQAIQGLLTAEQVGEYSNEHVASIAYVIADAMMEARKK